MTSCRAEIFNAVLKLIPKKLLKFSVKMSDFLENLEDVTLNWNLLKKCVNLAYLKLELTELCTISTIEILASRFVQKLENLRHLEIHIPNKLNRNFILGDSKYCCDLPEKLETLRLGEIGALSSEAFGGIFLHGPKVSFILA